MRKVLAVLLAGIFAAGASACSGAEPDSDPFIGVALPSHSARWTADAELMRHQIEAAGYRADIRFAGGAIPTQVRQVTDLLDDGADALVVVVIDVTTLANVLERAATSGIPVIAYDRLPRDTRGVDAFATFDHRVSGRQQAWSLLTGLGLTELDGTAIPDAPTGPFTIELFAGPRGDPIAELLLAGALDVLQPLMDRGVLVVGSGQTAREQIATPGWGAESARDRLAGILAESYVDGRHLDAVLSPDDRVSAGVVAALDDAELTGTLVSGRGAGVEAARAILDGVQYSTVFADSRSLADAAVGMVLETLLGEAVETTAGAERDNGVVVVPTLLAPTVVVVADNLRRVLVGSGYLTEEELQEGG